jgi:hypothetical protein
MGNWGWEIVPDGCDCCGRDAEDCGMLVAGWVADAGKVAGGGIYCRACAHLLRIARIAELCAWCEAPMVEEETAEAAGWAYFADELGELHPCCPRCLAGRFGIASRFRLRDAG